MEPWATLGPMTIPSQDPIATLITLMRNRQHAQALEQASATSDCQPGEAEARTHCAHLARWYRAAMEGRGQEGLPEAVAAVARLSDAGWREHLGFAYGSVGFVFGLLGDFETALEWLEVAIEDARRRHDREQLAGSISQKGGVLAFAEEWSAAFECFTQALDIAGPLPSVPRNKALNNLSYTQYVRATESTGLSSEQRHQLAQDALGHADRALAEATDPERDRWRSWGLSNRAAALVLLGRPLEAEQAFQEGLALGLANPRGHLELLVGYAALLIERGQSAKAAELLDQATEEAPAGGLVDPAVDRIDELKIQLAVMAGRHEEAVKLSDRRFRQAQSRYRARLRNVRRHMELFTELEHARRSQLEAAQQVRAMDEKQGELRQQARFWRLEALRDATTGTLNRRGLEQAAPRLLLLDRPCALVLVRMDRLESLVDAYGRGVGNEVMAQTAMLLANAVRASDLLACLDSQAFCVVLSPSDAAYARMIGQQIRSSIASHAWDGIAPGLLVTATIGTAAKTADESLQELTSRAEAAVKRSRTAAIASAPMPRASPSGPVTMPGSGA